MAFPVEEFRDIVRIIEQHPEWRAELRRLVLTEELLSLPQLVRELGEAQKRTEERVEELAQAQKRTEERLTALAEEQERTSRHLGELAASMQRIETQFKDMGKDVGDLKGITLELGYQNRAAAYFFRLIRGTHVIPNEELQRMLITAVEKGQLSEDEMEDVLWADVVARGKSREEGMEVYLVAEVSWGIGPYDVERAARRAELLAKKVLRLCPLLPEKALMLMQWRGPATGR